MQRELWPCLRLKKRSRRWADLSHPKDVTAVCLSGAVAPAAVSEAERCPKDVRGQVDRTPQAERAVAGRPTESVELVDECSSVEEQAGIFPDPNLETSHLAEEQVAGEHDEPDEVVVVVEHEDFSLGVANIVGLEWKPTDASSVQATSSVQETQSRRDFIGWQILSQGQPQRWDRCRGHRW